MLPKAPCYKLPLLTCTMVGCRRELIPGRGLPPFDMRFQRAETALPVLNVCRDAGPSAMSDYYSDRRHVAAALVAARQRRRAVLIGAARHRLGRRRLVALRREEHEQEPEGHRYRTDLDDLAFLVGRGYSRCAHLCSMAWSVAAAPLCSAFGVSTCVGGRGADQCVG